MTREILMPIEETIPKAFAMLQMQIGGLLGQLIGEGNCGVITIENDDDFIAKVKVNARPLVFQEEYHHFYTGCYFLPFGRCMIEYLNKDDNTRQFFPTMQQLTIIPAWLIHRIQITHGFALVWFEVLPAKEPDPVISEPA